jgi:hypothetical protein
MKALKLPRSIWMAWLIALLAYPLPWLVSLWLPGLPVGEVGFALAFSLASGALLGITLRYRGRCHAGLRFAALVFALVLGWRAVVTILDLPSPSLQTSIAVLVLLLVLSGMLLMLTDKSLNA